MKYIDPLRIRMCGATLIVLLAAGCAGGPFGKRAETKHDPLGQPHDARLLRNVDNKTKALACQLTAEELIRSGNEPHAIEQLKRARKYDPKADGVAHRLAVLYDRQGQIDSAAREYSQALRESPKDADLLNDYGWFLYQQDELEQAEEFLRKALKHQPKHEKARVNLGMTLAAQGRMDEAQAAFERAVGPAAARHNIGVLLAQRGETERARRYLAEAERLDPSLRLSATVLAHLDMPAAGGTGHILPAAAEIPAD